jgi:predicted enzyme related to lactoylglutathione lyase
MPPFDVLEAGRMALGTDPTGAVFALWEPRDHIGAGLVNVPGSLTWNELGTTDVEAAKQFYTGLLGWTYQDMEGGPFPYTVIRNSDHENGGMRPLGPAEQGAPPYWVPYFGSESCAQTSTKATELGGKVLLSTTEVPNGKFAAIADPQGAVFTIFEGDFDD